MDTPTDQTEPTTLDDSTNGDEPTPTTLGPETHPYAEESMPPLRDVAEAIRGSINLLYTAELHGIADGDDAAGTLRAASILTAHLLARLP